jgi:YD repeat-containing protein
MTSVMSYNSILNLRNVRLFVVGVLCVFVRVAGFSQGLPPVIMPNPEPAKIASYGKYEISNFTGKPNISIPLYTIKTSRLEVPIGVTYEATGVKVNDIASNVGLGFFLNAGGVITRAIVGLPDEYTKGYLNHIPTVNDHLLNQDYLYALSYYQEYDLEPDKYYYNFNGISGEFSFDVQRNVFNMGMNGLVITRTNDGFTILDEQGNLYEFTKKEYTTVEVNLDVSQFNNVTSWWLTKITSADKSDVIDLEYETEFEEREQSSSFTETYGPKMILLPPVTGGDLGDKATLIPSNTSVLESSGSMQTRSWSGQRLSAIKFRNGRVDFKNVKDRQDVLNATRLDRIEIFAKTNTVDTKLKTIKFITDYFHYTGLVEYSSVFYADLIGRHRLKLNSIEEYDKGNNFVFKHNFEYDMSSEIPYRGSLVYDYWGYNNGAYVNNREATLVPAQQTDDARYNVGGANREPNEQAMKAGVLTKITYPTGGSTKFGWEAHRYFHSAQTVQNRSAYCQAYGNTASNTPDPSKTFTFTISEDQTVTVNSNINYVAATEPYDDWAFESIAQDEHPTVRLEDNAGNMIYSAGYGGGVPVVTTTRYLPAGTYKLIARCYVNNVYASTSIEVQYKETVNTSDIRLAGGLRIAGIENYSSDGKLAHRETYKYGVDESNYGMLSMSPGMMNTLAVNRKYSYVLYYEHVNLTRKTYVSEPVASISLSGGSSVVYPVVTKYVGDKQANIGKTIFRYHYEDDVQLTRYPTGTDENYVVTRHPWRSGYLTDLEEYKNEGNVYTLVRRTHNDYTELGRSHFQVPKAGFVASPIPVDGSMGAGAALFFPGQDYYNTLYPVVRGTNQLTSSSVEEYDPSGPTLKTITTLAYDAIYSKFPTSKTVVNSKGESRRVVTKYPFDKEQITGLPAANKMALDKMVERNIISPVVETLAFKDNTLLERTRVNSLVWDVSPSNAGNVIKPESLERQVSTSPTEIVYRQLKYDVSGNVLEQAKNADMSTVYLWGYSSCYPIAEIKNSSFSEVLSALGLTQVQLESNAAVALPSTDYLNRIANLRTNLPKAQVTTYTYNPLEGMSSTIDPNGITTYYEYDDAGRLRYLRDKDNNIVKSYQYNYRIR